MLESLNQQGILILKFQSLRFMLKLNTTMSQDFFSW